MSLTTTKINQTHRADGYAGKQSLIDSMTWVASVCYRGAYAVLRQAWTSSVLLQCVSLATTLDGKGPSPRRDRSRYSNRPCEATTLRGILDSILGSSSILVSQDGPYPCFCELGAHANRVRQWPRGAGRLAEAA
jgi:hypothetical protein